MNVMKTVQDQEELRTMSLIRHLSVLLTRVNVGRSPSDLTDSRLGVSTTGRSLTKIADGPKDTDPFVHETIDADRGPGARNLPPQLEGSGL